MADVLRAIVVVNGLVVLLSSTLAVLAHVQNRNLATRLRHDVAGQIPGFFAGVPVMHVIGLYAAFALLSCFCLHELWVRFGQPYSWRIPYLAAIFTVGNLAQGALLRAQIARRKALRELERRT